MARTRRRGRTKTKYGTYPRERLHLLEARIDSAYRGEWTEGDAHLNAAEPVAVLRVHTRRDLQLILKAQKDLDYLRRLARAMARELKRPSGELDFLFPEWDELVVPQRPPDG